MKKPRLVAIALFAGLTLGMAPALAADMATKAPNAQQSKMKTCQAEAGQKKLEGKERQAFVNDCLKAKPAKAESKISMCNKKTAGLKGEERKKAQSECMKAG